MSICRRVPRGAVALLACACLALGACGGDDEDGGGSGESATTDSAAKKAPTKTPPGPGAINDAQAGSIPIGTPKDEVLDMFGEPAARRRQKGFDSPCWIYERVGATPGVDRLQVCFGPDDKLAVIASDIRVR